MARKGGFSLLEVVITVAILTGVTLSSLLAILPVSRQARIGREVETATAEVRKVLERVHSVPFSSITLVYPHGTQVPISTLKSGLVTITYTDPAANPLFLQATVSWSSPDLGDMSRTFQTVRTE